MIQPDECLGGGQRHGMDRHEHIVSSHQHAAPSGAWERMTAGGSRGVPKRPKPADRVLLCTVFVLAGTYIALNVWVLLDIYL